MIQNDICQKCIHYFVCKNLNVLEKFDSESKKYIGVDISILSCRDFSQDENESDNNMLVTEAEDIEDNEN